MGQLTAGAGGILGRNLQPREADQFSKYLELLVRWQKVHRLVGSTDAEWIVSHLFLDSLLFTRLVPGDVVSVLDFGSGAGFPGLPVKIVTPRLRMTLLEARARRVSFLRTVIRDLALDGVDVLATRAEQLRTARDESRMFDAVVSRCAGGRAEVLRMALPLVRPGGLVILSGSPEDAANTARGASAALEEVDVGSPLRTKEFRDGTLDGAASAEIRILRGPSGPRAFFVVVTNA